MTQQPKIRPEARSSLTNLIISAMERDHNYLYQSCINCEWFQEKTEQCFLVKQRPPAKVIVFGCEKWIEQDEIPF